LEQEADVMNTKQVAEFMGVSMGWIYKNMMLLPHRRVGSLYFFHKPTIAQWLADGHTPTEEVVESEMSETEISSRANAFRERVGV
jgi:hypothetical protein